MRLSTYIPPADQKLGKARRPSDALAERADAGERAVQLGRWSGTVAIYVVLWAAFAYVVVYGFVGARPDDGSAMVGPAVMLVIGVILLGTLGHRRNSLTTVAVAEVVAGAGGVASLIALASSWSFWRGPFMAFFAVPPALSFIGGAVALVALLRRR